MKIVTEAISRTELKKRSDRIFGGLVKAIVDVRKKIMVVDVDMHADGERILLEQGSKQDDVWGINLYPEIIGDDFIEFDSMINVRPRLNNFSRNIESKDLQNHIITIVNQLVKE